MLNAVLCEFNLDFLKKAEMVILTSDKIDLRTTKLPE